MFVRIRKILLPILICIAVSASPAFAAFQNTAPKIRSVQVREDGTVFLNWRSLKKADGYAVYRSENEGKSYKRIKTIHNWLITSYTDRKCLPGETYFYRIKAFRFSDQEKCWSRPSFPTGVLLPGAFRIVSIKDFFATAQRLVDHYKMINPSLAPDGDPFQSARLLLKGRNRDLHFERFDACAVLQNMDNTYIIQFPDPETAEKAYQRLKRKPYVLYVEPDVYVSSR